ncbi:IS1634 family transposase [Micromonospora sp. SL1-18]|uniref:IS1634 family transposase n=1 Tax=Micromonospora sp. SL1-18 TaxID=3399128 RepID=UPI003A4DBE5C
MVRYVQLAHNRRVGGTTQAEVLHNFGREDRLDTAGLRRLVASINRYLGEDGADVSAPAGGGLEVTASLPIGAVWLLEGLWRQLEIDRALVKILGERRFRTDVERVLFALVANRAIAPASKLSAAEWASRDASIPGLAAMDEDQAYRAMDLLVEADAQAEVQEAVFFAVANLLNLEVDLLFFDTTNTYFERDEPDAGETPFRAYGKSKDHRDDLPQITIGLAVTKEGVPVRCWGWPGGTRDQAILPQVKDDMRDWKLGRVITVVDRGFSSADNLSYLTRAGGHYIAGMRMRDGNDLAEAALARQGRYQDVRDNLRVKEVRLDQAPGRRFVICHNPAQAERDRRHREEALTRIEAELERIKAQRDRDAKRLTSAKARERAEAAHVRAECALIEHPTLKRWLRTSKNGRLAIDRAKVKAEERLDGRYLLTSSDPHLSAEEIAVGYKALLEAERGFRDLKTVLELRPVFHRLEHRIRAHVLLCWLALLLIRVAERSTGSTWNRIGNELGRVHEVTLTGEAGRITQTTPLTAEQTSIYRDCGIKPPPRITTADPV